MIGFSDSDWAGDKKDCKSTASYCFLLGSSAVSWATKKQDSMATSSCEAKYKALFSATQECIWLKRLVTSMLHEQDGVTYILCNSKSALSIAHNSVMHGRTKHLDIAYHYVQDMIDIGRVDTIYVNTTDNVADMFTNALSLDKLKIFRLAIGIREIPTIK